MEIVLSLTAEQHGYGTEPWKWVSGATPDERKIARSGGLVLFLSRPAGGNKGTRLRKMVYNGRYIPRVPSAEELQRAFGAGVINQEDVFTNPFGNK